ncbi:MAG: hypothetical protein SVU32_07035 [Candidatus Nanohaloarchaea archaeon]|nr:hypothetical protein [Candidatus Nanohaloarchaea archaeon]
MMRRTVLLAAALLVLTAGVAAAGQDVEARPGWIGPGSMLYPLDTALDGALMAVGLRKPSGVAFERASEAKVAYRNNNSAAAAIALRKVGRLANRSTGSAEMGKAASVLEQVQQQASGKADQGLSRALRQVRNKQGQVRNQSRIGPPPMPDETQDQGDNGSGGVGPPPVPGQ